MALKYIIGLKTEIEAITEKYKKEFQLILYEDAVLLKQDIKDKKLFKEEALIMAASDEMIALGKELGIATMVYACPDIPNQTYEGVDMIVEGFEEVDADFLEKVYQRYHHIPWKILETERCVVRELALEDLDDLFELYEDEELLKYTEGLYPYEEEKEFQRAYIDNMYRFFGYGMWLVFLKDTGVLIGRAGLEHREYHEEIELELGYLIGRNYQGKGYAVEVCNAILDYAKRNTGFDRINCLIEEGNKASIRLAEKLGFSHIDDYELDKKRMHRFIFNFK